MNNDEIINFYKFAKDPIAEITILSELTLKPVEKIVSIIREAGYTVDDTKIPSTKRHYLHWTEDENKQLLELKTKGLKYEEIALVMSRTVQSVKDHLRRMKRGIINV